MTVLQNGWREQRVVLRNKNGLHMRPAQQIVETAERFQAEVAACKNDFRADAKSILEMIEFASHMVNQAAEDDHEFVFRARGTDAEEALKALRGLVEEHFGLGDEE